MEERRVAVDEALAKMEDKHSQEQEELKAKQRAELKELDSQDLGAEELQQRRAQLLNRQQIEQSGLDRRQADERKQIQHGTLSDWEVRFARAKLELKEKHYKVCNKFVLLLIIIIIMIYRVIIHGKYICSINTICFNLVLCILFATTYS